MKDAGSIVSMEADVSVMEQTQGLDWVHWLLRSVRQRCEGVVWQRMERKPTVQVQWRGFVRERFLPQLSSALLEMWELAATRDCAALIEAETRWSALLNDSERQRSMRAGHLLLQRTHGARYQGALGHYRVAVDEGTASGHIGVVWPTLAQLFQLTPAAMLSEYLRLEWETSTRELVGVAQPIGSGSFSKVVSAALSRSTPEPRVLRRRQEA